MKYLLIVTSIMFETSYRTFDKKEDCLNEAKWWRDRGWETYVFKLSKVRSE